MRKLLLFGALALNALMGRTQFTGSDVVYYVGEGPDTAYLVIDFLDDTPDSSYAWGYLFDATEDKTGGDMLAAMDADEPTLNVVTGGGFLNEIHYNAHSGVGGDPDFWGTWSKTEETEWESNEGLGTVLANGDYFGCSYMDFDPVIEPGEPLPAYASTKYSDSDVAFWVGEGADSAVFVIDFISDVYGEAVSYAWGYAFDGPVEASEMLTDIDEADVNLSIDAGAFLNDILFNDKAGLAGDPYYWGTWSGTNLSDWVMNAGISTEINDGDWFGCSYGAWPSRRPYYPISAIDSTDFLFDEVDFLISDGENKVVLVIDFNEWLPGESYAYGYGFDGESITAAEVMEALELSGVYGLHFDLTGGFLNAIENDVTGEEGIGGMPNYWGTWSASNVGGWEMNTGIGEELTDGDWFGCSYTSWSPATPPSLPENGFLFSGLEEDQKEFISVFPNPTAGQVQLTMEFDATIRMIDFQGRICLEENLNAGTNTIDLTAFTAGIYLIEATSGGVTYQQKLVIQ